METVSLQKQRNLTDSEQTIADIRKFRWEESKKIKTDEDFERYCNEAHNEFERVIGKKKNYVSH